MDVSQFRVPVRVIEGPERPVLEIYGAEQALAFLEAWPSGRAGPLYRSAKDQCAAAMTGAATAEDARRAFAAFARSGNFLAKDGLDKVAIGLDGEVRTRMPLRRDR